MNPVESPILLKKIAPLVENPKKPYIALKKLHPQAPPSSSIGTRFLWTLYLSQRCKVRNLERRKKLISMMKICNNDGGRRSLTAPPPPRHLEPCHSHMNPFIWKHGSPLSGEVVEKSRGVIIQGAQSSPFIQWGL